MKTKFAIRSYEFENGNGEIVKMYPIGEVIKRLQNYEDRYDGIVSTLSSETTIEDIMSR